jgi:chemotaxis protein methyltransferase CheR
MEEITITPSEFDTFSEFFYEKTGISFERTKRYFVDKRLVERIEATGHSGFRGYFSEMRLEDSGSELQHLTNLMTINETYFLREEYQFQCMVDSILPEIVKTRRDGRPIRIWTIPSSSGEEPYSIALYLLERWAGIREWDVQIVASDIDTGILRRARAGRYSARAIQHVPAQWREKYFVEIGDEFQICDDVRRSVEFTRVNLAEPQDTIGYRNFDIVFCRNLLIYFDDISRKTAGETFFEALDPGGFICLGHSESMNRISSLYLARRFPDAIVYQKPTEAP